MKSVGEVMAVGRSFEESLQKAIRMVDSSNVGWGPKPGLYPINDNTALDSELISATPNRIFALAEAMDRGYTVEKLNLMTNIDVWWLNKLQNMQNIKNEIKSLGKLELINKSLMQTTKAAGFSDLQIASYCHLNNNINEMIVRNYRKSLGIIPVMKQIDTLAAEFPAQTNYLYATYGGKESDVKPDPGAVTVLGSGVYRIGKWNNNN